MLLTLNLIYVFVCLFVCMLVCVCVCVRAAVSAGLSLAVPARLSYSYVIVTVLDELNE